MEDGTLDPRQLMQNGGGGGYGHAAGSAARPQTNGLPQDARPQESRQRVPTVAEALPFSPFSSIVPFNPDIMHTPLALSTTSPAVFENDEAIKSTRRELERLTAGATNAEQASKRCETTLNDIQKLLLAENLTDYKFKETKRPKSKEATDQTPQQPKLSSFAKMVYDSVKEPYRYLTPPEEPGSLQAKSVAPNGRAQQPPGPKSSAAPAPLPTQKPKVVQNPQTSSPLQQQKPRPAPVEQPPRAVPQPQKPSPAQQPHNASVHQQARGTPVALVPVIPRASQQVQAQYTPHQQQQRVSQQNLEIPISKQIGSQELQATPGGSQKAKLYVQPATLTPSQRAAFQKVNDVLPDPRDSTPSRGQGAYLTNNATIASSDQRRKADQAVEALLSQLEALFEAEDQMQPDTSEAAPVRENRYFSTHDTDEGPALILQADVQALLNTAFQKVVNHNRLDSIEVDQLTRIQRICERSVSALGSGSLAIGDDWSDDDVNEWVFRLQNAENGIIAARTLLHIMTGGSHRKELQSEDCLRLVLNAVHTGLDTCILPVVELRSFLGEQVKNAPANPRFKIAVENRNALQSLVAATTKTLALLGDLFAKTDVDETGISSLVYSCKMLIFASNAGNERDSALGIQIFEAMRKVAMNVISKIFTKYDDQRRFIIDEMLLSLEHLPANKQSARQFRLSDGKPVQLMSALLMRLVQSSAVVSKKSLRHAENSGDEESEEESEVEDSESDDDVIAVGAAKKKTARKSSSANRPTDLSALYQPLQQESSRTAAHIANMLLQRAIGKSKSSTEDPFRRLLDVFTEDFINVLGSSDWPAAEVLLRQIVARLMQIADDGKQPAPARTLALELLGTIGSGIMDVLKTTADAAQLADAEDHVSQGLASIARQAESGDLDVSVVTSFEGPYRVLLEYLHARNVEKDPQLLSARGYHLVQWADAVSRMKGKGEDQLLSSTTALENKIRSMMVDINWLEDHSSFAQPTTAQGKLAAKIVTANSSLCRALPNIIQRVTQSMGSQQPTVRSRALKSVTTLLEKDPAILDRNEAVLRQILRSLSDPSSLVRDSALNLIQKCVAIRPALELKVYEKIVERTTDASHQVRKRAMAFLKQVYLHVHDNRVRAKISNAMISRIHDVDESVVEVARATIEEIWFSAFRGASSGQDRSVDFQIQLAGQVALIVQTVDLGDNVASVLEALLKTLMTKSKQAVDNKRICKAFVRVLFDGLLDSSQIPGAPTQETVLRTLIVFAKTVPEIFLASQLELLGPYSRNLNTGDELEMFRSVIIILRYTMPELTGLNVAFLKELQNDLMTAITNVGKSELSVIAPCLWTIDSLVGNRVRLVNFVISALAGVCGMQKTVLEDQAVPRKVRRLLVIIGQFGKACQFDTNLDAFRASPRLNWYKGNSVAGLMAEICCKFTSPKHPMTVREAALDAVCAISHTYPKNYLRADVNNAIEMVFEAKEAVLEEVLISSFETFFTSNEKPPDDPDAPEAGSGIATGAQRLGNTYQAEGADVALNSLCQRFMQSILRIATTSLDEAALGAARTVASVNRMGLMNPSDSAPGLVALMTCPVPAISKIAFLSYKEQYFTYNSVLEKTMLKSVILSYEYQRNVAKDLVGFTGHPPVSKLHYFWDAVKTVGFQKNRTKFFDQLCGSLTFDPAKMTTVDDLQKHLLYVRYCVENIAFLDHDKLTEPLHAVACLEKAYAGAGLAVTQAIESDIFKLQVPVSSQAPATSETLPDGNSDSIAVAQPASAATPPVESEKLLQHATSAQILSLLVETRNFLRSVWLLKKHSEAGTKSKAKAAKDAEKNAVRATNAPALTETYQSKITKIMGATQDGDSQLAICKALVELMTVDNEAKVASGDEDEIMMEDDDDARSEGSRSKSPAPRGKKRKSTGGQGGGPKKKGRPRKSSISKMDEDEEEGWD
ncbi:Protein rad9 [Pseudocercospora fuligena]|uniref:Sister chromatid cohesion protein n=1 Tax=Pseudocercospora fuligena TaxID=685502 RepID=A0A8H6RTT4_9PEZI|nr:Protein rad9 [Pseudocercospora fuligena]